jgi:hypothetical protein
MTKIRRHRTQAPPRHAVESLARARYWNEIEINALRLYLVCQQRDHAVVGGAGK